MPTTDQQQPTKFAIMENGQPVGIVIANGSGMKCLNTDGTGSDFVHNLMHSMIHNWRGATDADFRMDDHDAQAQKALLWVLSDRDGKYKHFEIVPAPPKKQERLARSEKKRRYSAENIDGMRNAVAANPHDTTARRIFADSVLDEGDQNRPGSRNQHVIADYIDGMRTRKGLHPRQMEDDFHNITGIPLHASHDAVLSDAQRSNLLMHAGVRQNNPDTHVRPEKTFNSSVHPDTTLRVFPDKSMSIARRNPTHSPNLDYRTPYPNNVREWIDSMHERDAYPNEQDDVFHEMARHYGTPEDHAILDENPPDQWADYHVSDGYFARRQPNGSWSAMNQHGDADHGYHYRDDAAMRAQEMAEEANRDGMEDEWDDHDYEDHEGDD